ncbi:MULTISPECIES: hypothetical protein [unclassified Amycolatopsis]|uniref:hypothetical protein n=1 Tax=unclassified Amycolatopsis TaxID=2618356 RepID=UPI002876BB75|nr:MULTISPECIES: hypothetical protein [unclassified Amycolatopsis]MDS0140581.1 hypothetical protein [Amycolatopsis sp. 505]MDS0149231.1 hypothetical protein [Amycolatopsis sp. CM201R]
MSAQLVGRQGHSAGSGGRYRITPFGGVLIEPERPAQAEAGAQVIDQAAFDQLMRLMPDLDPDVVKKIMGVVIRPEEA